MELLIVVVLVIASLAASLALMYGAIWAFEDGKVRYYINQVLIKVAIKCLEMVQFRSLTNQILYRERMVLVKRMRQCI